MTLLGGDLFKLLWIRHPKVTDRTWPELVLEVNVLVGNGCSKEANYPCGTILSFADFDALPYTGMLRLWY